VAVPSSRLGNAFPWSDGGKPVMPMRAQPTHRSPEQDLLQALGSRIKELRERQGLSQRALSQQLRISKSIVAKYEAGLQAPTLNVAVRLANLFGITLDSLLGRDMRDPRLVHCLGKIQGMDAGSRVMVVDAIEAIVNAYTMLFERGEAEGPQ
jgi:transcriptional regulator with XRE-family HTH domain